MKLKVEIEMKLTVESDHLVGKNVTQFGLQLEANESN